MSHSPIFGSFLNTLRPSAFMNWKFRRDYGGNYGSNMGLSCNLLITFVSRTHFSFQRDTLYLFFHYNRYSL